MLSCINERLDQSEISFQSLAEPHEAQITDYENVITNLQAENERLKRCYESATGKPVCGEGSVIRMECQKMANLREENERLKKEVETTRKLIEVLRHERVYKNPMVKEALAAY